MKRFVSSNVLVSWLADANVLDVIYYLTTARLELL